MVYRVFTEKKKELAAEARALLNDINTLLQIKSVTSLRVINRYDAENITKELFDYAVNTVFSEPQLFEGVNTDNPPCTRTAPPGLFLPFIFLSLYKAFYKLLPVVELQVMIPPKRLSSVKIIPKVCLAGAEPFDQRFR